LALLEYAKVLFCVHVTAFMATNYRCTNKALAVYWSADNLGLESWKFVGSRYRDKAHDDITISWYRITPVCSCCMAADRWRTGIGLHLLGVWRTGSSSHC